MSEEELNPYIQMRPERAAPRLPMPELDEVAWAELEDAYGPATAVPEQIRALTSPDAEDRAWAIEALDACIHHQGSVYSGSVPAVRFLVELAGNPEVEARERILELLAGLAVHVPDECLVNGAFRYRSPAYDEVRAGGPTFVGRVADPDPAVRTATAFLLCFLEPPPSGARDALRAQLAEERHDLAKAAQLMALGYLSRYVESREDRDLLAGHLDHAVAAIRVGAGVGLAQMEGMELGKDAAGALEACYSCPPLEPEAGFWPWLEGDLAGLARTIREAVIRDEELLARMDDPDLPEQERANAAHKCVYRQLRADRDRLHDLVLPEDLDATQRKLLRWVAENAEKGRYDYEFFERQGLPDTLDQLRRFLGIDSGGCEQRLSIAGRELPGWYAIHGTLMGGVDRSELLAAAEALGPDELAQLVDDALTGPWHLDRPRGPTPYGEPEAMDSFARHTDDFIVLMADVAVRAGDAGLAWAQRVADQQVALGKKRRAVLGLVAALVLARAAQAEADVLAERYDPLLALDQVPASTHIGALRRVYALLPSERRHRLLADRPLFSYTAYTDPTGTRYQWTNRDGWRFLELMDAVEAARLALDALLEWDRHRAGRGHWTEHARGGVESTLKQRPEPDQPFPEDQALEALFRAENAAEPLLREALDNADLTSRSLVERALAKIAGDP